MGEGQESAICTYMHMCDVPLLILIVIAMDTIAAILYVYVRWGVLHDLYGNL
jgi:hypothetical protein